MKIGLISDTHGYLDQSVFDYFSSCDEVWHAGDIGTVELIDQLASFKKVRAVYGNIDGQAIRQRFSEHDRFEAAGLDVWMTHIGGGPPRYNSMVRTSLQRNPPDIFVCGHSHILKIMSDNSLNNMLYINPGAAGKQGFHKVRTLVRFEILNRKVVNMQVIELGTRVK